MTPGSHAPTHVADFPGIADAACAGTNPSLWFPERGDNASIRNAQRICAGCPVKPACAEYSLDEVYGVWAGTTEGQRRRLRRQRRQI